MSSTEVAQSSITTFYPKYLYAPATCSQPIPLIRKISPMICNNHIAEPPYHQPRTSIEPSRLNLAKPGLDLAQNKHLTTRLEADRGGKPRARYLGRREELRRGIPGEAGALARPVVGGLVRVLGEPLRLHRQRARGPRLHHGWGQSGGGFWCAGARFGGNRASIWGILCERNGGGGKLEEEDDSGLVSPLAYAEPWFGLYRAGKVRLTNYG